MDADETVLDNSEYQLRRAALDSTYTVESWAAWVNEAAAPAISGDNIQDFPGLTQGVRGDPTTFSAFGHSYFVIPNPMYGSWEGNETR